MDALARVYPHADGPGRTLGESTPSRRRRLGTERTDAALREHASLVREVALAIARRKPLHVELEELVSWGMEGLLDAWRRYRSDKHASFPTYARFRIRGAILDNLRSRDLLSRAARRKAVLLDRTRAALEAALGRPPREEEIAEALQLDLGALRRLMVAAEFATVSIEDLPSTTDGACELDAHMPDHDGDPALAVLREERAWLVEAAVGRLPVSEHAAVTLYYRDDLTMRQVGGVLGVSESRVSQLHAQALGRLRGLVHPDLVPAQ